MKVDDIDKCAFICGNENSRLNIMITVVFSPPIPYPLPKFHLFYHDCVKTMETKRMRQKSFSVSRSDATEGNGNGFLG